MLKQTRDDVGLDEHESSRGQRNYQVLHIFLK